MASMMVRFQDCVKPLPWIFLKKQKKFKQGAFNIFQSTTFKYVRISRWNERKEKNGVRLFVFKIQELYVVIPN